VLDFLSAAADVSAPTGPNPTGLDVDMRSDVARSIGLGLRVVREDARLTTTFVARQASGP